MTQELALTKPDPTMDEGGFRLMMAAAQRYVQSGLLPPHIKTPQAALLLLKQGRELGIADTYALRNITVINGRPSCSAELMLALVRRAYGQSAMRVYKTDNESCTVQYRQHGWDGISELTFSLEDAKRAGLLSNQTWSKYPAAMLRARAISATVRFAFPECIAGLYTPEEVGADVDEDGSPLAATVISEVAPTPIRSVAAEQVFDPADINLTDEEERRAREAVAMATDGPPTVTDEPPTRAVFEQGWRRLVAAANKYGPECLADPAVAAFLEADPSEMSDEDIQVSGREFRAAIDKYRAF